MYYLALLILDLIRFARECVDGSDITLINPPKRAHESCKTHNAL